MKNAADTEILTEASVEELQKPRVVDTTIRRVSRVIDRGLDLSFPTIAAIIGRVPVVQKSWGEVKQFFHRYRKLSAWYR